MKSAESAGGMGTVTNGMQSTNEKDEVERNMESFQKSVTMGSAWFQSAKENTFTTFEMVKKDLNEFTDVVASEACSLASTTIKIVRQQAYNFQQFMSLEEENDKRHKEASQKIERKPDKIEKPSLRYAGGWVPKLSSVPTITEHSWIKTIVHAMRNIAQENTIESEECTEKVYLQLKPAKKIDLPHHILYEIQSNPDTYMKIPEGDRELFRMWCDDFKLAKYDSEINALLANCPRLRALYQEMVPGEIENPVFWMRYFYKVRQMKLLVRCKADTEKQLLQDEKNEGTQEQKWLKDFEKDDLCSDSIGSCLSLNTELTQSQISPDRRSAVEESWSLCSSTNVDIQV